MPFVRCLTCHGEYDSMLADGTRYFHACPPLSVPELKAALDADALTLTVRQQRAIDEALRADHAAPPLPGSLSNLDRVLQTLRIARVNARNENVGRQDRRGDQAPPQSEGLGVVDAREPAL